MMLVVEPQILDSWPTKTKYSTKLVRQSMLYFIEYITDAASDARITPADAPDDARIIKVEYTRITRIIFLFQG